MQSSNIWPLFDDSIESRYCAALFIDIRGSSALSATLGLDSKRIANRTRLFIQHVRELLVEKEIEPNFIKSLGDGLLCIWDFVDNSEANYPILKQKILIGALNVNEKIGSRLTELWGASRLIELGLGLSSGDTARVSTASLPDYFGYPVNLASKLQGFARPRGLVIDGNFVDTEVAQGQSLQLREFHVPMTGQPKSLSNKFTRFYIVFSS